MQLHDRNYWSTLEEASATHDIYEQRCNLHLAYIGNWNFVQLTLWTVTVQYEIFGIPDLYKVEEVDTKPQILGTLTSDENETLEKLMGMGLGTSQHSKSSASASTSTSASARSQKDLNMLKTESTTGVRIKPPRVEPLLRVYKLCDKDIKKIKHDPK